MEHLVYLFINLGAVSIPFLATFDRRLRFHHQWKYLFPAMILTMLVFIPWDMVKTHLGVWGFNTRYLSGIYLGNLPVEEWLFFIAIPYSCLFTYHALNYLIKRDYFGRVAPYFAIITGLFLVASGFSHSDKLYTTVTFISAGAFLFLHGIFRSPYLGRFLMMYFITLLPFFIVNGLLTGWMIPEEVVFYDNSQNLGIRLITIPVEDSVYGMLMLLMNVSWLEFLKKKY